MVRNLRARYARLRPIILLVLAALAIALVEWLLPPPKMEAECASGAQSVKLCGDFGFQVPDQKP